MSEQVSHFSQADDKTIHNVLCEESGLCLRVFPEEERFVLPAQADMSSILVSRPSTLGHSNKNQHDFSRLHDTVGIQKLNAHDTRSAGLSLFRQAFSFTDD